MRHPLAIFLPQKGRGALPCVTVTKIRVRLAIAIFVSQGQQLRPISHKG
jgi:hypothetical protein